MKNFVALLSFYLLFSITDAKTYHTNRILTNPPSVAFTADKTYSCDGVIQFTDNSTNTPTSWKWDFGDGDTSVFQNPSHTYTNTGIYDVTLISCNGFGCDTLAIPQYITVDFSGFCDTVIFPVSGFPVSTYFYSCNGILYDDGGPNGDYSINFDDNVTINPPNALGMNLTFNSFNLSGIAKLKIYDGPYSFSPLLATYDANNLPPPTLYIDGPIRINFNSYGNSTTASGFEIAWQCVPNNCDTITGLTVNNIQTNSANLQWTNPGDAASYILRWKNINSSDWIVDTVLTNNYMLTNLYSQQVYEWQTRSICSSFGISAWSTLNTFTTSTAFSIVPDSLSAIIVQGDSTTQNFTINNLTNNTLQYNTAVEMFNGNIYKENFEEGNYNSLTANYLGNNYYQYQMVSNQTDNDIVGYQSLEITGGNQQHLEGLAHTTANTVQPRYISFYINTASNFVNGGHFSVGRNFPSGGDIEIIRFNCNAFGMGIDNSSSQQYRVPYNANEWYFIEFKNIDFSARTYDYYVNGQLAHTNIKLKNFTSGINQIRLYNYDNTTTKFDNIMVNSNDFVSTDWLSVSNINPVSPSGTTTPNVHFTTTNTPTGNYNGTIEARSFYPDSMSKTVHVNLQVIAVPVTDFTSSHTYTCTGDIGFTDISINSPTSWLWDFGDGNTSTAKHPNHVYTNNGFYDVSLIACNPLGCDTIVKENYLEVAINGTYCDTTFMPTSGTITLTTCTGVLYDDGGPNGNYSNSTSGITIIQPTNAQSIILTTNYAQIQPFSDGLEVYDGTTINDPTLPVYNSVSGLSSPVVTSTGGAIAVKFFSNNVQNFDGFEMSWQCIDNNCTTPTNLSETNLQTNQVTLNWENMFDVPDYNLRWREVNTLQWETLNVLDSTFTLQNLAGGTTYEWQVQKICSGGAINTWSTVQTFTTVDAFSVVPDSLNVTLLVGDTSLQNITVSNLLSNPINITANSLNIGADILEENFERDDYEDWVVTTPGYTSFYDVSNQDPSSGEFALEIEGGDFPTAHGLDYHFEESTPEYISFDIKVDGSDIYPSASFTVGNSNSFTFGTLVFVVNSNSISILVNNSEAYSIHFIPNQWYHVEFRNINFTTKQFDCYINNILLAAGINFSDYSNTLNIIRLQNESESPVSFDNIIVKSTTNTNNQWLTIDAVPNTVNSTGTVTTKFDATDLSTGIYESEIRIKSTPTDSMFVTIPCRLEVVDKPETAFEANNTKTCAGTISFADLTANEPTSWLWDFGDGNTSTQQNPTNTYVSDGVYDVSLITCNPYGCDTLTKNQYVEVDFLMAFCDTIIVPTNGDTIHTSACTGVIYDSGGPNVDINQGLITGTIKINVPTASAIKLTFSKFRIATDYGKVRVYDGHLPSAPLIADYDGSINTPPIISSTGVITIQYFISSNNFSVLSGFEIHWQCMNAVCGATNNPQTSNVGISEATTSWNSSNSSAYLLEWREIGHPLWNERVVEDTTYVITGLEGQTDYEWRVTNYCDNNGLGLWNSIDSFTTGTAYTLSTDTLSFTMLAGDSLSQQIFVNNLTNNALNIQTYLAPVQGDMYYEGFEDGTTLSLDTDGDNHQTYEVSRTDPASGIYNLNIIDGSGGILVGSGGLVYDFNNSTPAYISFDVKVGTSGNRDGTFVLTQLYQTSHSEAIHFTTTGAGMGTFSNVGNNSTYFIPYNINEWYHIEFRNIDFTTYTYDYYANYNLVAEDIPFTSGPLSHVNRIEMRNEYFSASSFDNINMSSVDLTPPLWLSSAYDNDSITINISTNGYTEGLYDGNIITSSNLPDSMNTTIYVQLNILERINAGFITDNFFSCNGDIQFTDTSAGTVTSWLWDFGDGNVSTMQNPNHIYANSGIYDISLIACNSLMCDTVVRPQYIEVDYGALYCDTTMMVFNQSITATTCTGVLYDNGGPLYLYLDNSNDTTIIQPSNAQSITIEFDTIALRSFDSIKVYSGLPIAGNLVASYTFTENSAPPMVINDSIATVVFVSNQSLRKQGFRMNWACTTFDCAGPSNLSTNLTLNDATLHWNSVSSGLEYNVRWKPIIDTVWSETTTLDTFYFIDNLVGNQLYEWQVQSLCSGGNIGVWGTIDTFLTNSVFTTMPDTIQVTLLRGDSTTQQLYLSNLLNDTINYNVDLPPSPTVFADDFESGTYNDWTIDNTWLYTHSVVSTNPANGQYSFQLSGGVQWNSLYGLMKNFGNSTPQYISFKVKTNNTTSEGANILLRTNGLPTIRFNFDQNGMGLINNIGAYKLPFNANQWYHIELKNINYTTHTVDYYVDGQLIISNVPFNINRNSLDEIVLYNYDNSDTYLDDVIISTSTYAEPDWLTTTSTGTLNNLQNDSIDVHINTTGLLIGNYEKMLTVNSLQPDSTTRQVLCLLEVIALPEVSFEANKNYSCDGIIEFNSSATTYNPNSWFWDFGDGDTSMSQNPIHTYQTDGIYDVTLVACNLNGCDTLTKTNYVNINLGGTYCDTLFVPTNFSTIINNSCTGVIYDDGGPNGNYSTNTNGTIVIEPTGSDFVVLTIQSLQVESCCDILTVYDGNSIAATPIPIVGNNQQIVSSTNALTVKFTSNSNTTDAGFELTWACFDSSTCFVPIGLFVDSLTPFAADLNWTNLPNVDRYALRWRTLGTTTWQTDSVTANLLALSNLMDNTPYEWQVKTLCNGGNNSNWSVLDTFSTTVASPYLTQTIITDVTCNSSNDGSIDVEVGGGILPYSYLWTTGDTTQDLSNITAGNYTCTVTDSTGMTLIIGILTVNEPTAITLADTIIIEDDGTGNGSIDMIISGGTPPYQYDWNNGDTTVNIANLMTSIYEVTVTDATGCTAIFTIDLPVGTNDVLASKLNLNIHPNPVRSGTDLIVEVAAISDNLSFEIHNLLGQRIDSGLLNVQSEVGKIQMPSQQGVYLVTILVDAKKVKTFRVLVE